MTTDDYNWEIYKQLERIAIALEKLVENTEKSTQNIQTHIFYPPSETPGNLKEYLDAR